MKTCKYFEGELPKTMPECYEQFKSKFEDCYKNVEVKIATVYTQVEARITAFKKKAEIDDDFNIILTDMVYLNFKERQGMPYRFFIVHYPNIVNKNINLVEKNNAFSADYQNAEKIVGEDKLIESFAEYVQSDSFRNTVELLLKSKFQIA